ncbi:unnamed protein product [Paramecium sonneborni]|uniref:Uncharacterized protein n=1 Tax=Paramecium sonneborni TaxID=65129 RepID=A0A8S1RQ67_9CILI|nr:unnamed protein product [Paramecium sonneborni]
MLRNAFLANLTFKNIVYWKVLSKHQIRNVMDQSPRETGKTVSLLYSSMNWLQKNRIEQQKSKIQCLKFQNYQCFKNPCIIKIDSLRIQENCLQPSISMIGSRDQYCLLDFQNQDVETQLIFNFLFENLYLQKTTIKLFLNGINKNNISEYISFFEAINNLYVR